MSKVPLCLVVLSLVFTSSVRAQVIRSHEGLDRNAVDSLFIQAELSLDGGAGNADYLDLRLTGGLSYRVPAPGHWLRFYPSYRIKRSEEKNVVHERSAHIRHSYVFSDAMRTYAFVQIQADQSIDLDRRLLVGGRASSASRAAGRWWSGRRRRSHAGRRALGVRRGSDRLEGRESAFYMRRSRCRPALDHGFLSAGDVRPRRLSRVRRHGG